MISFLKSLDRQTLHTLAGALQSGRLSAPFTPAALQRYCPTDGASATAGQLQRLVDGGLQLEHLALMLEAVAQERTAHVVASDAVDLVWSGPEAAETINRDTGVVVRELFASARQSVLVAGFAIHQGQEVFQVLAEHMEALPQLQVQMFLDVQRHYTDTTMDSEILARFAQRFKTREWPGSRLPQIFYDPRSLVMESKQRSSLHAKCITIDQQIAFVTSANFTQAAQGRNIEVGLLLRSPRVAAQITRHFEALTESRHLLPVPGL